MIVVGAMLLNILTMKKNVHILAIIFWGVAQLLSCKSSHQKEYDHIELPAYQSDDQNIILNNIINSSGDGDFHKLLVYGKEYPIRELKRILDTIDPGYKMQVKTDSVSNKKLLVIKRNL